MKRKLGAALLVTVLALGPSLGCATTIAMTGVTGDDADHAPYGGVRKLWSVESLERWFFAWPVDFVLSGVADTLALPYTMTREEAPEE